MAKKLSETLQPTYDVVIRVKDDELRIYLYFTEEIQGSELFEDLKAFQERHGFGFDQHIEAGRPYCLKYNPTYSVNDIGIEILKILNKHKLTKLGILHNSKVLVTTYTGTAFAVLI